MCKNVHSGGIEGVHNYVFMYFITYNSFSFTTVLTSYFAGFQMCIYVGTCMLFDKEGSENALVVDRDKSDEAFEFQVVQIKDCLNVGVGMLEG